MNAGKRYCLADYILTIYIPSDINFGENLIKIGGEGDYLSSITVSITEDNYSIVTDNSGNWLYNRNLARNGKLSISLQQVSDKVAQLKTLFYLMYNNQSLSEGLNITLTDNLGNLIVTCEDCVITKIPDQTFGQESATQDWSLLSGRITF